MARTLPIQSTHNDVSSPHKSFKYLLFDLLVVTSLVVAIYLGWRDNGKAPLPATEHAATKSNHSATKNGDYWTDFENSGLNQEEQEGLSQLKDEVGVERQRVRDELVAQAAAAAGSDAPLIDDEEMLQSLTEADTLLMQIDASLLVLEIERRSWPLCREMRKLSAGIDAAGSLPAAAALVKRYLKHNAAHLDEFRDKVEEFRALDARLIGRGGALGEGYRERMDSYELLHNKFKDLRGMDEEVVVNEQNLRDQLLGLASEL